MYVFDEADGNLRMVSDGSQRKGAAVWSKDGSRLSWSTTIKGSPDWGIVVADVQNPDSRKMVYRGQGANGQLLAYCVNAGGRSQLTCVVSIMSRWLRRSCLLALSPI